MDAVRRRPRAPRCAVLAAAAIVAALARPAEARPQVTSGLTTGAALTDFRAENGPRLAYHLGARVELLFGRESTRDMALGPYLEVLSAAFDTLETGAGVAWLVPTADTAFVVSGGGFVRTSRFGLEPGVATTIFWGARGLNYHSPYAIGAGLFAQGRYGLGEGRQADVVLGVQVDLEYLVLPWIFAYTALTR